MINTANRFVAATGAIVATLMTVAATAIPARAEEVRAPVSYADLDLASPAGAAAFHARVGKAATKVCGEADALNRFPVAYCRARAIAAANRAVTPTRVAAR